MTARNLFDRLPAELDREAFETLASGAAVRIERIVSQGHSSPETGWYDQDQDEWVVVLQGRAELEFADGSREELGPGDYLEIPAHTRHRVSYTSSEPATIWLAVHYAAAARPPRDPLVGAPADD